MDTGADADQKKFLRDPYLEWCAGEAIPVVEGLGVHLPAVEVKPWARFGANGAFVHLAGRGDWLSMILLELPPAGNTSPQRHMFEEVVHVVSGQGSTTVESAVGTKQSFEWGRGSLFALPPNARFQHFNGSGREPARLAATTNLPMVMKLFRSERFVFDNPFRFRTGESGAGFSGEGAAAALPSGLHVWETDFVPDLVRFELQEWESRGVGGSSVVFALGDGAMHAHLSEMPVGLYRPGHRGGADFQVVCLTGHGYSLFWQEGEGDMARVDWRPGTAFAPTAHGFQQHFNTAPFPARYLATAIGGLRYPLTERKRRLLAARDVGAADGEEEIAYRDQDPRIHRMFLDEIARTGVQSAMGGLIDEGGQG